MKEQTYGWYPSAKNVYEERRLGALTPYQIEALYRFRDSKYYQPPVTPCEGQTARQTPQRSGSAAKRPSSTWSKSSSKHSQPNDGESKPDLQLRAKSAPIHTQYRPPPRLNLPTPQQCWSTQVPETEITVQPAVPSPVPSGFHKWPLPKAPSPSDSQYDAKPEEDANPNAPENIYKKIIRIKSATMRRDAASKPTRSVRSAGPVRPSPVLDERALMTPERSVQDMIAEAESAQGPYTVQMSPVRPPSPSPAAMERPQSYHSGSSAQKPPTGKKTPLRPKAPSPYQIELNMTEDDRYDGSKTPDYDEQARKHGWLMEVHGDPLKLKKVSRRLPYYVTCPEPETERDPPKVHMENNETFFLNTIPRRPMAFTIHKEWISEVIHKKRLEMQKKHGLNYRFKNFSFVY